MGPVRIRARLLLAAGIALLAPGAAGGCAACDASCGAPTGADRTVEATVVNGSDGLVRFRLDDASTVDARVFGRASALREGSRYTIPLFHDPGGDPPTAALPRSCDCGGPYITEADGSAVDLGGSIASPVTWIMSALAVLVGLGAVALAVALVTRRISAGRDPAPAAAAAADTLRP